MKKIYVIQTVFLNKNNFLRDRVWGWYSSKEKAIRSVISNELDMFEDQYYNVAIIEEVYEGLGKIHNIVGFYKRFKIKSNFLIKEIKLPGNISKNICNFTMG